MNRRTFITTCMSSLFFPSLNALVKDDLVSIWNVVEDIQDILFPKTENMPSAKMFNATFYLIKNIYNEHFDKDDFKIITEGTLEFKRDFPDFSKQTQDTKYHTLEIASENRYYEQWLSILIYYTIEAMMSDPIYGGNTNEIGWISTMHVSGQPQPILTYGKKHEV